MASRTWKRIEASLAPASSSQKRFSPVIDLCTEEPTDQSLKDKKREKQESAYKRRKLISANVAKIMAPVERNKKVVQKLKWD